MAKFTTLSLNEDKPQKSKNGAASKPKNKKLDPDSIPDEKKWALIQNLLLDVLSSEIKENTEHLFESGMIEEIDINAVLITAWLDYIAGYYCYMAEETEGVKTKKGKIEHEKYDDYASRAIDAYLTAKAALLFYVDNNEETE